MHQKISNLKSKYSGERIFIIGNGPSLQQTPLKRIQSEYSIGMNKIHEIYDSTPWRPSFYLNPWSFTYFQHRNTTSDEDIVDMNIKEDIPCFLDNHVCDGYSDDNLYPLRSFRLHHDDIPFHQMDLNAIANTSREHLLEYWSDNLDCVVYEYHAMYVAIQLAAYLGFDQIYILGSDLGRSYRNPHMMFDSGLDPYKFDSGKFKYILNSIRDRSMFQSIINALAMKSIQRDGLLSQLRCINDHLHFSPTYDNRLIINDFRIDDQEIRKSHLAAKRICNNRGIEIYNATIGGELDIYPRVNLDTIV